MTHKIQANASGSRTIDVTDEHLATIERHRLLDDLVDSHGIVDESVVDKLRFNTRSLLGSERVSDKDLLDLCLDVVYNQHMKAFGLQALLALYRQWQAARPDSQDQQAR